VIEPGSKGDFVFNPFYLFLTPLKVRNTFTPLEQRQKDKKKGISARITPKDYKRFKVQHITI